MTKLLGVIAEDASDIDVLNVLVGKIARQPFAIRRFVGHGCGRVRNKCRAWAQILRERGCRLLLVVHDLDSANLEQLRRTLTEALGQSPIADHIIIIPVRELEAWLLADHDAIRRTFKFERPLGQIANPEAIQRPKERLRDLIRQRSDRRVIYVNTIHNVKIAKHCAIANLRRCASFRPLEQFILRTLK